MVRPFQLLGALHNSICMLSWQVGVVGVCRGGDSRILAIVHTCIRGRQANDSIAQATVRTSYWATVPLCNYSHRYDTSRCRDPHDEYPRTADKKQRDSCVPGIACSIFPVLS